jgi:hypothetical protein
LIKAEKSQQKQKPPETTETEQIDIEAKLGTAHTMRGDQLGCEKPDAAENRHECEDKDTTELKRLLHDSEP